MEIAEEVAVQSFELCQSNCLPHFACYTNGPACQCYNALYFSLTLACQLHGPSCEFHILVCRLHFLESLIHGTAFNSLGSTRISCSLQGRVDSTVGNFQTPSYNCFNSLRQLFEIVSMYLNDNFGVRGSVDNVSNVRGSMGVRGSVSIVRGIKDIMTCITIFGLVRGVNSISLWDCMGVTAKFIGVIYGFAFFFLVLVNTENGKYNDNWKVVACLRGRGLGNTVITKRAITSGQLVRKLLAPSKQDIIIKHLFDFSIVMLSSSAGLPIIFHPQAIARRGRTLMWIWVNAQLLGDQFQIKMVKVQPGRREGKDKGKAKAGSSRRGRKTRKKIMENLFQAYAEGTPSHVKSLNSGWEQDLKTKVEEGIPEDEMDPILTDPGHTKVQEFGGDPKVASILAEIRRDIQEIHLQQHHQNVCLGRIDRQLQNLHQVDMPGSSVKESEPIESSDD